MAYTLDDVTEFIKDKLPNCLPLPYNWKPQSNSSMWGFWNPMFSIYDDYSPVFVIYISEDLLDVQVGCGGALKRYTGLKGFFYHKAEVQSMYETAERLIKYMGSQFESEKIYLESLGFEQRYPDNLRMNQFWVDEPVLASIELPIIQPEHSSSKYWLSVGDRVKSFKTLDELLTFVVNGGN